MERFNDKGKRAELFCDYFNNGESLDDMLLVHTRRHTTSQRAMLKFRPMSKQDMMVKFHHDVAYVQMQIDDAKLKKRWKKDTLCPDDETKHRYWVLDDESMSFEQLMQIENELTGTMELDAASGKALTQEGGFFSANQSMGMAGFGSTEVSLNF
jgi:hypothetical protein